MAPYDACYITQEVPAAHVIICSVGTPVLSVRHLPVLRQNGSYVLPMLWLGSPLKLSCPVATSQAFSPTVLCFSYSMMVQMYGQEPDLLVLGFIGVLTSVVNWSVLNLPWEVTVFECGYF